MTSAVLTLSISINAAYDYNDALHSSTKFFGAQRCGNTDSWIHGACHTNDGGSQVDLTGGWHDCGDHVKFGQTNGFSGALLLHGYLNFTSAYDDNYSATDTSTSNGIPDVLDEVKYFTDYLLKTLVGSTVSNQRLYFQVSDATTDHQTIQIPENTPNNRIGHYEEGGGASNIAGTNAAVLAMMYRAYKDIIIVQNKTARECIIKFCRQHKLVGSIFVFTIMCGSIKLYSSEKHIIYPCPPLVCGT